MTEVMDGAENGAPDTDTLAQQLARCQADRNAAMAERDAAMFEQDALQALVTSYQQEVARYQATVSRKNDEMEAFRGEVVRVASEAADEHGWCSVIDDMLKELGLERSRPSYTAELTVTIQFEANRTDSRDTPSRDWVHDSIHRDDLEQVIHQHFAMDSDNENVNVTDVSFSINGVEENS